MGESREHRATTIEELSDAVMKLAVRVARCNKACPGIACDLGKGEMPRCLWLERRGDDLSSGAAIVGMNPGKVKPREKGRILALVSQHRLRRNDATDDDWSRATADYYAWVTENTMRHWPYYSALRCLADALDRTGPILWTEIVKCQSGKETKSLFTEHPATVRSCASTFLASELDLIPADWPIIAAGRDAYHFVADSPLARARRVIGVPHPTGAAVDLMTVCPSVAGVINRAAIKEEPHEVRDGAVWWGARRDL